MNGIVNLTGASLRNPSGKAFGAWGMRARELTFRPNHVAGTVDLRHSDIDVLRDDPDRWPGALQLDGAKYLALRPLRGVKARLAWLNLDIDGYRPQPYEQLASIYRRVGQDEDARAVLLAKVRRHRVQRSVATRVWGHVQDAMVGYGYRPARALVWLLALTIIGTVAFHVGPPRPMATGTAVHFNSLVYTLDLLVPIVDLGQQNAFVAVGIYQWFGYALTATGWILFTAVAAALTRALSRT